MPIRIDQSMTARQLSDFLSPRACRVLEKLKVHTVGELGNLNPARIKPILGAGPKTMREITSFQEKHFGPYDHPVRQEVEWANAEAKIVEGLEDAMIGYTEAGRLDEDENPLAVYDSDLCVEVIMDRGETREDAGIRLKETLRRLDRLGDNAPVFILRKRDSMTAEQIIEELGILNPEARTADGFDRALVGYTDPSQGRKPVAVYDRDLCVKVIMDNNRSDEDEDEDELLESAEDQLNYDTYRSLVYYDFGENAPIFIRIDDSQTLGRPLIAEREAATTNKTLAAEMQAAHQYRSGGSPHQTP
jgi:hypothetical protein